MNKLIILLLFSILFSGNIKSESKDTTMRYVSKLDSNSKKQICEKIIESFLKNDFKGLTILCSFTVEFFVVGKDISGGNKVRFDRYTEYGAISELEDIVKSIKYEKFKIFYTKTENNINIIQAELFKLDYSETPFVEISFFLNKKDDEINAIMVR